MADAARSAEPAGAGPRSSTATAGDGMKDELEDGEVAVEPPTRHLGAVSRELQGSCYVLDRGSLQRTRPTLCSSLPGQSWRRWKQRTTGMRAAVLEPSWNG